MEIYINKLASQKLLEKEIEDDYIKIYFGGFGWTAGLQMEFEDEISEGFRLFNVDGYKILVSEDLCLTEEYLEIKYSDNFLVKGFYVSNRK